MAYSKVMSDAHDPLLCPHCHALMQTGFIPVSRGMVFIKGDGKAAHHFAEGLPGTHAIMRTNKLLAWRCKACEFVVFRYGRDNARRVERLLNKQEVVTEPWQDDPEETDTPRR